MDSDSFSDSDQNAHDSDAVYASLIVQPRSKRRKLNEQDQTEEEDTNVCQQGSRTASPSASEKGKGKGKALVEFGEGDTSKEVKVRFYQAQYQRERRKRLKESELAGGEALKIQQLPTVKSQFPLDKNELSYRVHAVALNSATIAANERKRGKKTSDEVGLMVNRSYWSAAEKDAFFHSVERRSRLQPELIASDVGCKSVHQVIEFIAMLEDGLGEIADEDNDENMDAFDGAEEELREVSQLWVKREEELSAGLQEFANKARLAKQVQDHLREHPIDAVAVLDIGKAKDEVLVKVMSEQGEKPIDGIKKSLSIFHLLALERTRSRREASVGEPDELIDSIGFIVGTRVERVKPVAAAVKIVTEPLPLGLAPAAYRNQLSASDRSIAQSPLWDWQRFAEHDANRGIISTPRSRERHSARMLALVGIGLKDAVVEENEKVADDDGFTMGEVGEMFDLKGVAFLLDSLSAGTEEPVDVDYALLNEVLVKLKAFVRRTISQVMLDREMYTANTIRSTEAPTDIVTLSDVNFTLDQLALPHDHNITIDRIASMLSPPVEFRAKAIRLTKEQSIEQTADRVLFETLTRRHEMSDIWMARGERAEKGQVDWWSMWEGVNDEIEFTVGEAEVDDPEQSAIERQEAEGDHRLELENAAKDREYEEELWVRDGYYEHENAEIAVAGPEGSVDRGSVGNHAGVAAPVEQKQSKSRKKSTSVKAKVFRSAEFIEDSDEE